MNLLMKSSSNNILNLCLFSELCAAEFIGSGTTEAELWLGHLFSGTLVSGRLNTQCERAPTDAYRSFEVAGQCWVRHTAAEINSLWLLKVGWRRVLSSWHEGLVTSSVRWSKTEWASFCCSLSASEVKVQIRRVIVTEDCRMVDGGPQRELVLIYFNVSPGLKSVSSSSSRCYGASLTVSSWALLGIFCMETVS